LKSNNFTIFEAIKAGAGYLKENNDEILDYFKESLLLMGYALNVSSEKIIINYENKITEDKLKIFNGYIERRAKKEPFAYIINNKEFYSIDFFVNKNVLIPRPDTEILVDESLKEIYRLNNKINSANPHSHHKCNEPGIKNNIAQNISIIDLGTGSGAIAVSIAKNYKYSNIEIFAADNSYKALNVAKKNAILNNVENKIKLTYFNILNPNIYWYNEYSKKYNTDFYSFDIIISNPPYIISSDVDFLSDEVKKYEPCAALDGGIDGLKFYRKIFEFFLSIIKNSVNSNLTSNKEFCLILEIDQRYKEEIKKIYELTFYGKDNKYNNSREEYKYKINTNNNKSNPVNITIDFIKDLSGKERVAKINYGKNDN
jgi:release factor glutamine methyltransferase